MLAAALLATAAAAVTRYAGGVPQVAAFVVSGVALAGCAWVVSFSTEQVGAHLGPARTGLLQATLGNLPEFFVVLFALQAGELTVAQTAIVGSILVNALFVLGLVIVTGALRAPDGVMRFGARLPNDTATLLLVASFMIVLAALATASHGAIGRHVQAISIVGAIAILVVYGAWVRQQLSGDGATADSRHDRVQPGASRTSAAGGLALLAGAGLASAFVSEWFVHALEPATRSLGISRAFAGLVIVATAGNAVEHAVGVVLAAKGRSELAIAVVKSSVAQIAALLYPLLVLVSLLTATTLTFALAPIYAGALAITAVLVWQITGDGEATAFEGVALMGAFAIVAAIAAVQ
ncbi:MAG: sodium:proton exchanger [Solirubrobacteraceae bacterium]